MKNGKILAAFILAGMTSAAAAQTSTPPGGGMGPGAMNPGSGRRGPPPAAIDACKGKASGTACSFTNRNNRTVSGTCSTPRLVSQGTTLVCRPVRRAPGTGMQGGGMQGGGMQGGAGMMDGRQSGGSGY